MNGIKGVSNPSLQRSLTERPKQSEGGFQETLLEFTSQVNDSLREAGHMTQQFAVGERYDLHEIMIATENAGLSFKLLVEIRNKLVEAYQEIMRMQM
jgi:flagellar hook-basal body complex protein FliE